MLNQSRPIRAFEANEDAGGWALPAAIAGFHSIRAADGTIALVDPRAAPPGHTPDSSVSERAGLVRALLLIAALAGMALWLGLLAGPFRLASGLLDARDHLDTAEKKLSQGASKPARTEALAADGAARRARAALDAGGPLLDLVASVPVAGDAMKEMDHLVSAIEHSAAAASGVLGIAQDALKGPDSVIEQIEEPDGSKGSRIRLDRIEELAQVIDEVRQEIGMVESELKAIDVTNLPKRLHAGIKDGIRKAKETDVLLADAQAGFAVLPRILGKDEPRTYLLGFQNTAEQRGTGGALLQFAPMTIDKGSPDLPEKVGSVYKIDANRTPISIPLPEDAWYVAGVEDAQRFGNANWSPDLPLSARLTLDYGRATPSDQPLPEIDGVIVVDPLAIQQVMPGTGPFSIKSGNRVSSSRVVHLLLYKAYASYPIAAIRRVVLNQVVDGFYEAMLEAAHPTELVKGIGTALRQKHMQIWMQDPAEQKFIERMDWDGAIESAKKDDYVFVVEQNVGGNKLDNFDKHTNSFSVTFEGSDALVSSELKVQNGIFLPQPRYSMGDTQSNAACAMTRCPVHRPMMNLYVKGDAELISAVVGGTEGVTRIDAPPGIASWSGDTPATHEELGKKVWSGTLQIPPGEEGTLSFDYRVPGVVRRIDGRSVYRLHLQHQPKVQPETFVIRIELPQDAQGIKAKGFHREGDTLIWEQEVKEDQILEVSWQR